MTPAKRRERHLADADFRAAGQAHFPAQRFRHQLQAEADAEIGAVAVHRPFADRGLLPNQPGMGLGFPHVHGAAHDQQEIIRGERRDRLAPVQHHDIQRRALRAQEVAEESGRLVVHMLKYKGAADHELGSPKRK